jgi:hypothetical protein
MCDTPKTYKEALETIAELYSNVKRHEKSLATAKKNFEVAKSKILAEHVTLGNEEKAKVQAVGAVVSIGVKRKTLILDNRLVGKSLEKIQEGLSAELAVYPITPLREYFAPKVLESMVEEIEYGARGFAVKLEK